jgi:hypothetical protein
MYRDRAYCARSRDAWANVPIGVPIDCVNRNCDRYADAKVIEQAAKAKLPIGWADLKTSKCGYQPREGQS